jgi:hypothetical protein
MERNRERRKGTARAVVNFQRSKNPVCISGRYPIRCNRVYPLELGIEAGSPLYGQTFLKLPPNLRVPRRGFRKTEQEIPKIVGSTSTDNRDLASLSNGWNEFLCTMYEFSCRILLVWIQNIN